MRKNELEITDPSVIEGILQRGRVLHLALCDGTTPYCLSVCYGFTPGSLYIHGSPEGKKIEILRKNPRVSFQVVTDVLLIESDSSCGWTLQYQSVVGSGTARFVTDQREKSRALDILMNQYSRKSFIHHPEILEKTLVIEIAIDGLAGKQSPRQ